MKIDRNQIAAQTLINKLKDATIGVVVRDINQIDPGLIVRIVSNETNQDCFVSIIKYKYSDPGNRVVLANDIETAVGWRSTPEMAKRIIVFVHGELPKLHSLNDLDSMTSRDISQVLLGKAKADLSENQPQIKFWEALKKESAAFPLSMVEDFVQSIYVDKDNTNAIPENMWRLGLLCDSEILNANINPAGRISRNRELIIEIGQLSEASRKRMGTVLSKAKQDKQHLKSAFEAIKEYYRRGGDEPLKQLDVKTVEDLIKAGRPMPKTAPVPKPTNGNGGSDTEPVKPLKGKNLHKELARMVVDISPEVEQGLRELCDAIQQNLHNTPSDRSEKISINGICDGQELQPDLLQDFLHEFVGLVSNKNSWGASVRSKNIDLKDIVRNVGSSEVIPYDPHVSSETIPGLFHLLKEFDKYLNTDDNFGKHVDALINSRERLLDCIDLLLAYPLYLLRGYRDALQAVEDYLNAYSAILRLFRENEAMLHNRHMQALELAASSLLRIEVVYIETPEGWKAMLTPLHPFYLWRFREILRVILNNDKPLNEEERAELAEAIVDLPHLLHYIVFSTLVTDDDYVTLPQSGSIGLLPTFENHTNRYLGNDGIEFLQKILHKWLEYSPFSRQEIRLALIDVPDMKVILDEVSDFLGANPQTNMVIDAYFTRGQNSLGDIAWLDYSGEAYELGSLFKDERLIVNMHERESVSDVEKTLHDHPVHICFAFDQSQYLLGYGHRAKELLVSPLVITYQYNYDDILNRGTISPASDSDEGIFADFHFLVERAVHLPTGQWPQLRDDVSADFEHVNSLIDKGLTRWLVVADRLLTNYAPKAAIPLAEIRVGLREVGVWAGDESRAVNQFVDILKLNNLHPDVHTVAEMLQDLGHVATGGMIGLSFAGNNKNSQETRIKGLFGTVLAAAWYKKKYQNSLIISLDSTLARQWLMKRKTNNERADLIGLRINENSELVIEPIEVKTTVQAAEARFERDIITGERLLVGSAIDQVNETLKAIRPIFGGMDEQPLLTPARREVLKYQLYRECFRKLHKSEWKQNWFDILNGAFARPEPRMKVEFSGIIVNVRLEETGGESIETDKNQSINLVTLGNTFIQTLVAPVTDQATSARSSETEKGNSQDETPRPENGKSITTAVVEPDQKVGSQEYPSTQKDHDTLDGTSVTNEIQELAKLFKRSCQSYRIDLTECDPARAIVGPTVIRFYIRLARGQRLDQLRNALEDIGREMSRTGLLVTQIPNSMEVALDIPSSKRYPVPFARAVAAMPSITSIEQMPIPIGVTPEGQDIIRDLGKMPHLLVGGTTGSGKTVFLYGLLVALLSTHHDPKSLRIMLSTSKPEDFVFFEGLPHLETGGIISDASKAVQYLGTNIAKIFENRQEQLKAARCRDIAEFNRTQSNQMPPIVVVVDEFADLADQLRSNKTDRDAFYMNIRRIAQLGRNRGVHLVLCTQRPSATLVPTEIRTLMNDRVALRVNDRDASKMILEDFGAERLQMHGDLLFKEEVTLTRAQGYYLTGEELDSLLKPLN